MDKTGRKKPLILAVDDDKSLLRLEKRVLEDAGFSVLAVSTGKDALEKLFAKAPDLILLDVVLPDIDGITLSQQLRKLTKVPIVLISGRLTEVLDRAKGLELGADDYVVKPVSPTLLVAKIRAVLRRSASLPYSNDVSA